MTTKWKLKGCPRCHGDVFIDRDMENNWYEQCLQCSYRRELKNLHEFKEQSSRKQKEPAKVD